MLISTPSKLEGKHPSRKDDMLSLSYLILFLIDRLPYQDFYFQNIHKMSGHTMKKSLKQMKKTTSA